MKKICKIVSIAFIFVVIVVALFFTYMTICDYKPNEESYILKNNKADTLRTTDTISVLTWNIGYAGLDAQMDFFYDGGTKVRPSESQVKENLESITSYLQNKKNSINFILLEEIDLESKRSYYINQVDYIKTKVKCNSYFSKNYSVKYVPIPLSDPMGKVESGITMMTNRQPKEVIRYSFPVNFSWPLKVFMLDRCFQVSKYPLNNGKLLEILVTHNSAFDGNGYLRVAELNYMKKFLENEYNKGNYIIVGGDFNQCPPNLDKTHLGDLFDYDDFVSIPNTLLKNWNYAYDPFVATNRRVVKPYDPHTTLKTIIDFFITSPNIKTISVKTDSLEFKNSDHNPVLGKFILN